MTPVQHNLMVCLIEECAEVQFAATKCLRFGLLDSKEGSDRTNVEHLIDELHDLGAIIELLRDTAIGIPPTFIREKILVKKLRVSKYLRYSQSLGLFKE